jgi:hypothetical protein
MERGNDFAARALAVEATVRLAPAARDVTASALRSAATRVLFETDEAPMRDLSEVLPGLDNTASWWRSQLIASGLSSSTRQAFRQWTNDQTTIIAGASNGRNHVASAELLADLAGLTSEAAYARGLRAQVDLMEGRDTVGALQGLLAAGDHASLETALQALRSAGSAGAVAAFAAGLDPQGFSRTTFRAGITALAAAGDYASPEHGARLATDVMDMLTGKDDRPARLRPRFLATGPLLEALAGVVVFAEEAVVRDVLDRLFDADHDETHELALTRLLGRLDDAGHLDGIGERMGEAARNSDSPEWQRLIFARRATTTSDIREATSERILDGDLAALRALPDLTHLRQDEVSAALAACWTNLQAEIDSARRGSMTVRATDAAMLSIRLLLVHHRSGGWAPLLRFLEDADVALNLKLDACRLLASQVDSVPPPVRTALSQALPAIRASTSMPHPSGQTLDTSPLDALQFQVGGEEEASWPLIAKLETSTAEDHRAWYVSRLRMQQNVDALTVLLSDPSPRTRASVVRALASIAPKGRARSTQALHVLEAAAPAVGEQALLALLDELPGGVGRDHPELISLLEDLARHPAWSIRRSASRLSEVGGGSTLR